MSPASDATSFSAAAWQRNADWFEAILTHPFLTGLADGSLSEEVFLRYLVDDMHYLRRYAQTLRLAARRWPDPAGVAELARFADGAVAGEQRMQDDVVAQLGGPGSALPEPTLTCLAYAGSLQADAATGPVEVAAAGILPCFRVYAEMGAHLLGGAAPDPDHPYGAWLSTYTDPRFASDAATAEAIVDAAAVGAAPELRAAMDAAYDRAYRFEWMFWDTAYRPLPWPAPRQAATTR